MGEGYEGSPDLTINNDFGPLEDRTAYRSTLQAMINKWKKEMGQAAFNQALSSMGFSSVSDYLNYEVNEAFANRTYGYSFSDDGTALFLDRVLPENKGANEFSGQTYYGCNDTWNSETNKPEYEKDTQQVYVFTSSGYTFSGRYTTIIGLYAYDSSHKFVWLRPSTIDGKDRAAFYAERTATSGHHLVDDNAYRAARTNGVFSFGRDYYNSTDKTIQ